MAGKPRFWAIRRMRTSGKAVRDQIRAAVARAVVDEHQLEAILRPFEGVEVFETANEVVPPVEGQHHQPDAGPGHVDHLWFWLGKPVTGDGFCQPELEGWMGRSASILAEASNQPLERFTEISEQGQARQP